MKSLKSIGSIFLLVVYLLGTTGISILHHVCNSSQREDVSVYPGVYYESLSNCCGDQEEAGTCCHPAGEQEPPGTPTVSAAACCISFTTFLRLEVQTLRADKVQVNLNPETIVSLVPDLLPAIPENPPIETVILSAWDAPPLISGRVLIQYLQQPKIPTHLSIA